MAEINFVVLKINGTDVSQLPEDKVVQMFLTAGEPLLVEMHRKPSTSQSYSTIPPNSYGIDGVTDNHNHNVNSGDHINAKLEALEIKTKKCDVERSIDDIDTTTVKLIVAIKPLDITITSQCSRPYSSKSTQTDDDYYVYTNAKETSEHFIEHEHNLLEQCLAPEIDIEEITLRKSDSNERLGLIVCYNGCINNGNGSENNGALSSSDDNDACTEVYISGIQPDSVAGRDGRLRQGDQILQINGKDIKNKEETELLIAENNNAVTLLVSRYLFTDEDDFNDPLMADLDVEYGDVEEEEEYYVESNMTYENCLPQNEPTNELNKVLSMQTVDKTKKLQTTVSQLNSQAFITNNDSVLGSINNSIRTSANNSVSPEKQSATVVYQPQEAIDTDRNEKELEQLFCVSEPQQNLKKLQQNIYKKQSRLHKINQTLPMLTSSVGSTLINVNNPQHINYETEHIYETIPEDSESEPFYCSPYESATYVTALGSCSSTATDSPQLQQQKKNVAKWLDICSNPLTMTQNISAPTNIPKETVRQSRGSARKPIHFNTGDTMIRKRNNTLRSTLTTTTNGSSSSGGSGHSGGSNNLDISQNDDHDYSSSAYNTGGSTNSTIPLVLVLNQNNRCSGANEENKTPRTQMSKDKMKCVPHKNGNPDALAQSQVLQNNLDGTADIRMIPSMGVALEEPLRFSTGHVYNNDSNQTSQITQKNICGQVASKNQHLQESLIHEQMFQQQNICCPQFIAPNLSQYHFVSSQEVSTGVQQQRTAVQLTDVIVNHKSLPKEQTMVWKVKRRQDGTRYIVRRPARNRCLLRDRSIRINTEHIHNRDISTTTEEDNISEVKTGRYWSKEERRKHFERARERKQQSQQQQQQMLDDTLASKMCTKIQSPTKMQQQKREGFIQQQRRNQHRLPQQTNAFNQQLNNVTPAQHYQLQFNSSRSQHQKPNRMVSGCDTNGTICAAAAAFNERLHISAKETAVEVDEIEPANTTTIDKTSGDGIGPRPTAAVFTNTYTFPVSVEGGEIQNFMSITTI